MTRKFDEWNKKKKEITFGLTLLMLKDVIAGNGLVYKYLHGLAFNFASTHQTENPRGFSEVSKNKQLLIAIVERSFLFF